MKYYIYISILACCLSVSSSTFATTTCQPVLPLLVCEFVCLPNPNVQLCTFDTGLGQNSAIATFNCGGEVSCGSTNARAHSIKFIVGTVHNKFSILVISNEDTSGQSNGVCESGIPDF